MKAAFVLVLVLMSSSAFAADVACSVDVYGKDSQKIAKLHQDVAFAQAAAGENFEYSPLISALPNLKFSCGRNLAMNMVSCSFDSKAGHAMSAGSITADAPISGVTVTFEDQEGSIAAGYSNTIISCVFSK